LFSSTLAQPMINAKMANEKWKMFPD